MTNIKLSFLCTFLNGLFCSIDDHLKHVFIKLLVIIIKKTERDILRFIFIGTTNKTKEKFEKMKKANYYHINYDFLSWNKHCC